VTSAAALIPTFSTYYMDLDLGLLYSRAITFPSVPGKPTYQEISQLGTLPSLFVGLGGCLTVPVAVAVGTRPTILLCGILSFCCVIWAAVSSGPDHGLDSHIAARCVLGLGAGAIESVAPLIIQDLNFVHHRNSRFSVLWSFSVRLL
jgi:MFS family permease